MTHRVEITDRDGTGDSVIVDRDKVAETIHPWYPAAVRPAINELQRRLDADEDTGEVSEFLGLGIFAADEDEDA